MMKNLIATLKFSIAFVLIFVLAPVHAISIADYLINKNTRTSFIEGHSQRVFENDTGGGTTDHKIKATPIARALAQLSHENTTLDTLAKSKLIMVKIEELTDKNGLVYLGGKVSKANLAEYLAQLKQYLGKEKFTIFRQHQSARDLNSFHVTLVNPYEYQTINKEKINLSQDIRVTLHGLGQVKKDDKESYFVIASSPDGQYFRQKLLLKNKDFHVTLGFNPTDIYGVSKGLERLMKK